MKTQNDALTSYAAYGQGYTIKDIVRRLLR